MVGCTNNPSGKQKPSAKKDMINLCRYQARFKTNFKQSVCVQNHKK